MAKGDRSNKFNALRRAPYPIVKIFTEGEITEPKYIKKLLKTILYAETNDENLIHRLFSLVKISKNHYQDPKGLVQLAVHECSDDNYDNDIIFIIIDEDDRTTPSDISNRNQAIDVAMSYKFNFIYSIPSFEYWALLHFQDTDAPMNAENCRKKLKTFMKNYQKELDYDLMIKNNGQEKAIATAKRIYKRHSAYYKGIDTENPTTNMYIFIEHLTNFVKQMIATIHY